MTHQILSPDYWETEWLNILATEKKPAPPANKDGMARWDQMARDFEQRTNGPNATARRKETIGRLMEKGILTPETRVLDIGAGPGSWALPLAKICAHVTALEPSSGMIHIMEEKIRMENRDNISVVQKTWQEVDLGAQGWEKAFDLVFASMTPGIDGPSAIQKMIGASCRHCYMSGFSGSGMSRQFQPLWEKFFDRPMPKNHRDIIYPFNLIYAMGFRPDITFSWWDREINWDREHTLRHFIRYFESHMDVTEEAKRIIADYVDTRCTDGEYKPATPVCRGAMTWSVDEAYRCLG